MFGLIQTEEGQVFQSSFLPLLALFCDFILGCFFCFFDFLMRLNGEPPSLGQKRILWEDTDLIQPPGQLQGELPLAESQSCNFSVSTAAY